MMSIRFILAALLAACLATGTFAAQNVVPVPEAKGPLTVKTSYDDPLGRSTPQGTVVGFLKAMEKEDEERAVDYLDTRQTGKRARQLALELRQVLDQGLSARATGLSSKPEGNLQDDLSASREVVGNVKTKSGEYKIILDRVERESAPPIWLFSSDTLRLIPQIYEEIDVPWVEKLLPAALTESRLAGQSLYRWLLPILMVPVAILFGWICAGLFIALVREPLYRRFDESALLKIRRMKIPLVILFSAGMIYVLSLGLVSLLGRMFWTFLASTMAVMGLTWIVIHVIEISGEIMENSRPAADHAIIRLLATLLKALAIVAGLVVVFYYFAGINLTAVVAGLGVGGIAVAFAAQKTIENFFGGVFLVWDKPIRLGDFCKAGEYQGTVEHIGLRSTKIRTTNRTVVFIPNGQLSSISVENFTFRDRFLFQHTLNLRTETTAEQLRDILAKLHELLHRHLQVDSATASVRFIGFGPSSLDVKLFAYITETAQEAFLAVQEDLLLRIMDIVASGGSGFAFPSQTLYMTKDAGLDGEKFRQA